MPDPSVEGWSRHRPSQRSPGTEGQLTSRSMLSSSTLRRNSESVRSRERHKPCVHHVTSLPRLSRSVPTERQTLRATACNVAAPLSMLTTTLRNWRGTSNRPKRGVPVAPCTAIATDDVVLHAFVGPAKTEPRPARGCHSRERLRDARCDRTPPNRRGGLTPHGAQRGRSVTQRVANRGPKGDRGFGRSRVSCVGSLGGESNCLAGRKHSVRSGVLFISVVEITLAAKRPMRKIDWRPSPLLPPETACVSPTKVIH